MRAAPVAAAPCASTAKDECDDLAGLYSDYTEDAYWAYNLASFQYDVRDHDCYTQQCWEDADMDVATNCVLGDYDMGTASEFWEAGDECSFTESEENSPTFLSALWRDSRCPLPNRGG